MIVIDSDIVYNAYEHDADLFDKEYILPMAIRLMDDDNLILKFNDIVSRKDFYDACVKFVSYNPKNDLLRLYSDAKKMLIIIKVKEWKLVKAKLFLEFFFGNEYEEMMERKFLERNQ